jgi:hypothetical protein
VFGSYKFVFKSARRFVALLTLICLCVYGELKGAGAFRTPMAIMVGFYMYSELGGRLTIDQDWTKPP